MKRLIFVFALFLLPSFAIAGDDVWDTSSVSPGNKSSITIVSTPAFSTPILETRLCGSGVLWTDDTDVTFDIQICRGSDASTCVTRNTTSPIDAATNFGAEFDVVGGHLRINVVSDASTDATFTFDCNP